MGLVYLPTFGLIFHGTYIFQLYTSPMDFRGIHQPNGDSLAVHFCWSDAAPEPTKMAIGARGPPNRQKSAGRL